MGVCVIFGAWSFQNPEFLPNDLCLNQNPEKPVNLIKRRINCPDFNELICTVPDAYTTFLDISDEKGNFSLPETCKFYENVKGSKDIPDYEIDEVEF